MQRRQGTQGKLDKASQSTLDNEFGTHVDEDVIKIILEKGSAQESTVSGCADPIHVARYTPRV